jgi:hypothetical protein
MLVYFDASPRALWSRFIRRFACTHGRAVMTDAP